MARKTGFCQAQKLTQIAAQIRRHLMFYPARNVGTPGWSCLDHPCDDESLFVAMLDLASLQGQTGQVTVCTGPVASCANHLHNVDLS